MQEPQETWIRSLVWEDPTFGGATKLMNHNFWACALEPVIHSRKRSHCSEKASSVQPESRPRSPQLARGPWSNEDPAAQPKINKRIQLFLKNDRNCASSTGHAGHGDIVFEDLLVPTCACVGGRPAQPSPALPCRTLCSGWAAQLLMNQSLKPPACMSSSWSLSPLPARPNSEDSKGSWCIPDAGNGSAARVRGSAQPRGPEVGSGGWVVRGQGCAVKPSSHWADLSSIQVDPEWEKSGFKQKSVLLLKNQKGQQYLGSAHIETLRYGLNFKIHMLKP